MSLLIIRNFNRFIMFGEKNPYKKVPYKCLDARTPRQSDGGIPIRFVYQKLVMKIAAFEWLASHQKRSPAVGQLWPFPSWEPPGSEVCSYWSARYGSPCSVETAAAQPVEYWGSLSRRDLIDLGSSADLLLTGSAQLVQQKHCISMKRRNTIEHGIDAEDSEGDRKNPCRKFLKHSRQMEGIHKSKHIRNVLKH